MDIARYCCFDVKVTRDVHWYGAEHGFIRYDDKKGGQVELPVDWKL
jgi:DEAD/DEAH box helicase domain protein